MKQFFYTLPRNIVRCFAGRNVLWHIAAIVLTFLLVMSGFDWWYFVTLHASAFTLYIAPAVVLGGLLPIIIPICCVAVGALYKKPVVMTTGWALAQAALIGSIISSAYKALTGRIQPDLSNTVTDISHNFNFGFLHHGIFWGWPSSHTTIAFAMAVTLVYLFPSNKPLKYAVLVYALYVGLSVSVSIHWFSEFVAGALIGTAIGMVVGTCWTKGHSLTGEAD